MTLEDAIGLMTAIEAGTNSAVFGMLVGLLQRAGITTGDEVSRLLLQHADSNSDPNVADRLRALAQAVKSAEPLPKFTVIKGGRDPADDQ